MGVLDAFFIGLILGFILSLVVIGRSGHQAQ